MSLIFMTVCQPACIARFAAASPFRMETRAMAKNQSNEPVEPANENIPTDQEALALDAMPKSALLTVVENLHRLAQAEALRDKGGKQHDMFAHLTQEEFAATQHRMDQPALF